MAKTELDHLIDRYLHGEVTPEEKLKIETWLDVMKTNKGIPHHLSVEEEDILAGKLMSQLNNLEDIRAYRPEGISQSGGSSEGNQRSLFYNRSFRIAASIVIILSVAATLFVVRRNDTTVELAAADQKRMLEDGSIVWLKKGSKLEFHESSDHKSRMASLTGEGLFEVAKDPSKPFRIACGNVQVLVTGTSFNLKTTINGIDLHLFTGHVDLSSKVNDQTIMVDPRQHVIYKTSGKPDILAMNDEEIEKLTGNTEYKMDFRDTPLAEVFEKLAKKFDVTITVENPLMNKCRIKADFTDTSLEKVLAFLKSQLDLEYKINGKTVEVTGVGCNPK